MTVINEIKSGTGWAYDEPSLTYDGATDPITGLPITYDGAGTSPTITNEDKNNV